MERVSWVLFDLNGTVLDPPVIAEPLGGGEEERRLVADAFREALMMTTADTLSDGEYRPLPDYLRAALERVLRVTGATLRRSTTGCAGRGRCRRSRRPRGR